MEELADYSSEIVEFKPLVSWEKQQRLVDNCTSTDALPPSKDVCLETNRKNHAETQTETFVSTSEAVDEKKLASWLRKIYPIMETEILKGPTPISEGYMNRNSFYSEEQNIQPYQKISVANATGQLENAQGLATWLAVHTNNVPILVVTTIATHDDWCEHVNQSIRIFIPKRVQGGSFIIFEEFKTIPVKACLKVLITNPYNKNIFVGSTLDGDIFIWRYEQSTGDVNMLFNFTATQGYATAIDWPTENRLLTCHSNGFLTQWLIGKEVVKETEFCFQPPFASISTTVNSTSNDITTLVCLSGNDFVIGTKDGGVYHCWTSNVGSLKKHLEVTALRRHLFMVSSLLRTKIPGHIVVISCDLSGQVFYHDIRNSDDESANVIVQIPLPFKNSIACSRDGNVIYCPGVDGSLECFSLRSGVHSITKGSLRGKGSLIKCSDNGNWIITGLYADEFQIFYLEN